MTGASGFAVAFCDGSSQARAGVFKTPHGDVETPAFMPVGTQGTVKAMCPEELREVGVQIILGNTYHLSGRPGMDVVDACGGLHRFMGWEHPILTDSGGFQVFSLAPFRKVRDDGVAFNSHFDGRRMFLGPREAMDIQRRLGSDVAMVLDECPPYPCDHEYACQAVDRTLAWAALCAEQPRAPGQSLFGIVQGSGFHDLRERCARGLVTMGLDGYAIGGVSVGEPDEVLLGTVRMTAPFLPPERPRYLMGVGRMAQIVEAVAAGVDLFDCVMPTRYARNGTAFTRWGRMAVKSGEFRADPRPIEEGCGCTVCRRYSRAYVRHLLNVGEILGARLLTYHNLYRYMRFMDEIRDAIRSGRFAAMRDAWRARRESADTAGGEPAAEGSL